jgi:hypothetical protein
MLRRVLNSGTSFPKDFHFEMLDPEYGSKTPFIK